MPSKRKNIVLEKRMESKNSLLAKRSMRTALKLNLRM